MNLEPLEQQLTPQEILLHERLLEAQITENYGLEARIRLELAVILTALGKFGKATQEAQLALDFFQLSHFETGICEASNALGAVQSILGDYQVAMKHHQEALVLARKLNLVQQEAGALQGQAGVYSDLGNYEKALELSFLVLELRQASSSALEICHTKTNIGRLYVESREYTRALQILLEVMPEARALNNPRLLTNTLINLGFVNMNIAFEKIDPIAWTPAKTALLEALQLSQDQLDAQGEVICLSNLGEIAIQEQQFQAAITYLEQAKTQNQRVNDPAQSIRITNSLGEAQAGLGNPELGLNLIHQALEDAKILGSEPIQRQVLEVLSQTLEKHSDLSGALMHLKALRQLERSLTDQEVRFRVQGLIIQYETDQLRREAAQERQRRNQLEAENAELAKLSTEDSLTSAYNRRYLETYLEHENARAKRQKASLCVAMIDIDFFKQVNDKLTHAIGDVVLKTVVKHIQNCIRKADVLARYGGEEFAVVFPDTTLETGTMVCERIRLFIENADWSEIHSTLKITVSIGLSDNNSQTDNPEGLLASADAALYQAKNNGRNQVRYSTGTK
jgi:diguanylate cyclase (GGDEF)-like protein